jgi:predicted phosphodiesterase
LNGRVYPDFPERDRFASVAADVVLLGHTHYQLDRWWGGKRVVNPGSVGQSRDRGGDACFAEFNIGAGEVVLRRVAYDPIEVITDARVHDPHLPYLTAVLTR